MGIKKNILVDGKEVPFKASAAVPRLYRLKFGRDIYRDFASLEDSVRQDAEKHANEEEKQSTLDIESLEMFENIAYIMARHADPENVPNEPDEWLEQFNMLSIYEVLPQLVELWGLNMQTKVQAKKNIAQLTGK
ncbi:MAG: hypothetical protein Q4D37_10590 [Oscillospiraceae bacterium]|nr:hypothetical protein [Oscillospiraceae bacterium]